MVRRPPQRGHMSYHHRSTRAWRRHDRARLKAVRSSYWSMQWRDSSDVRYMEACLGRLVATSTPCSCWMCGNPRRDTKDPLTLAEKKARDRFADGLLEWDLAP